MSIDLNPAFRLEEFGMPGREAGILFIDDFDAAPAVADAPAAMPEAAPAPAPPLTEADVAAAREAGWRAGFAAAASDAATREAEARAALAIRLGDLSTANAEAVARLTGEAARAVAAQLHRLLAACLPDICDRYGPHEATAMAAALLPLLTPALAVTLRCAPATLPHLNALLARPNLAGAPVTVMPDAGMAQGDLVLDWQDGAARRDTRALLAGLDAALSAIGIRTGADAQSRPAAAPAKRHEREADYV